MSTETKKEFNPAMMTERRAYTAKPKAAVKSERVLMQVTGYELPNDGPHFAVGHKIGRPDAPVRVRLNTIDERCADMPSMSREKVTLQYATGTNIRDSLAGKSKDGVTLLSFDDAKFIRKNEDGAVEFRAHWPKTMAVDPSAEVIQGRAHIYLVRDDAPVGKPGAYVELIRSAKPATAENIDELLHQGLAITDEQGRPRDPSVAIRLTLDGKVTMSARIYAAKEQSSTYDQVLGQQKSINVRSTADVSVEKTLRGPATSSDLTNRSTDLVRAVVAALKNEPLASPLFVAGGDITAQVAKRHADMIENAYLGVKSGHVIPEVVAIQRIDFGADSAKTYLKDSTLSHLAGYAKVDVVEGNAVSRKALYAATTVAIQRHTDGAPYAVFATPNLMFPFMNEFKELRLSEASTPVKAADNTTDNAAAPAPAAPAASAAPSFAEAPVADSVPEVVEPAVAAVDASSSAFDGEDAQMVIVDDSPNYDDDIPF